MVDNNREMNHNNPQTKSLSYEKRKQRWPLEYSLKELNEALAQSGDLTPEVEKAFYHTLVNLTKAIISHKYGSNSRIDYETLPHEIAASVFMTIVNKRKEVYSWTNLLKKVVRDAVSNHLRKEYYNALVIVDVDRHSHDSGEEYGEDSDSVIGKYESNNEIKPEDLVYFNQLVRITAVNISRVYTAVTNLKNYLILKLAIHEVLHKVKHNNYKLLKREDHFRYNYYVFVMQFELAPVLNQNYGAKFLYV